MPETLYLTCNIIDRYLAIRNVTRKRLQLVSLAVLAEAAACTRPPFSAQHTANTNTQPRCLACCVPAGGRHSHADCLQVRGDLGARGQRLCVHL